MAKRGKPFSEHLPIEDKIYILRKQNVMLDWDVAELYDVDCRAVREAVRTNRARFPKDCMFEMTPQELDKWRARFGAVSAWQPGLHRPPFCFTWKGIIGLSFLLDSNIARMFSVQVIKKLVAMLREVEDDKERLQLLEKLKGDEKLMIMLNWGRW
jgi:hypothetical protein